MELIGDVARKSGPVDRLRLEVTKTTCAASVAERTGLFHVPPVVRFDAESGVLETARVHGFRSLMQLVLARDPRFPEICERVGRAIAQVHTEMRLPEDARLPFPEPLRGERADECVLHGDLNGSNVGWDPATDRVVILDWSAAPALRTAASIGSRYFDVLWFSHFFFRFRPLRAVSGWSPERWTCAFLSGYAAVSADFSVEALRAYKARVEPFMADDYRAERERLGRGVRWIPYRIWQWLGRRRWEKFLGGLSDSQLRPRGADARVERCAASSES
jgi:hypothetical protein